MMKHNPSKFPVYNEGGNFIYRKIMKFVKSDEEISLMDIISNKISEEVNFEKQAVASLAGKNKIFTVKFNFFDFNDKQRFLISFTDISDSLNAASNKNSKIMLSMINECVSLEITESLNTIVHNNSIIRDQ